MSEKPYADGFQLHEASFSIALFMPMAIIVLALAEGASLLWRPLGFFVYAIIYLLSIFFAFGLLFYDIKEEVKNAREEIFLAMSLAIGLFYLVSFSQLSRDINIWWGGYDKSTEGYWTWMRFGVSNYLEAILLDVPAIYNWKLTDIKAISFWTCTFQVLFRAVLEFAVIAQLIKTAKYVKDGWNNTTGSYVGGYANYHFTKLGRFILLCVWLIPLSIFIGAIIVGEIKWTESLTAIQKTLPLMILLWFAWQNLKSLVIVKGIKAKILSLIAISACVWAIVKIQEDVLKYLTVH